MLLLRWAGFGFAAVPEFLEFGFVLMFSRFLGLVQCTALAMTQVDHFFVYPGRVLAILDFDFGDVFVGDIG